MRTRKRRVIRGGYGFGMAIKTLADSTVNTVGKFVGTVKPYASTIGKITGVVHAAANVYNSGAFSAIRGNLPTLPEFFMKVLTGTQIINNPINTLSIIAPTGLLIANSLAMATGNNNVVDAFLNLYGWIIDKMTIKIADLIDSIIEELGMMMNGKIMQSKNVKANIEKVEKYIDEIITKEKDLDPRIPIHPVSTTLQGIKDSINKIKSNMDTFDTYLELNDITRKLIGESLYICISIKNNVEDFEKVTRKFFEDSDKYISYLNKYADEDEVSRRSRMTTEAEIYEDIDLVKLAEIIDKINEMLASNEYMISTLTGQKTQINSLSYTINTNSITRLKDNIDKNIEELRGRNRDLLKLFKKIKKFEIDRDSLQSLGISLKSNGSTRRLSDSTSMSSDSTSMSSDSTSMSSDSTSMSSIGLLDLNDSGKNAENKSMGRKSAEHKSTVSNRVKTRRVTIKSPKSSKSSKSPKLPRYSIESPGLNIEEILAKYNVKSRRNSK